MNAHSAIRIVPIFIFTALFVSCSDDDPVSSKPPDPSALVFHNDTLYATPQDSVLFELSVSGDPAAGDIEILFGDGQSVSKPPRYGARIALPYLYAAKGTYTVFAKAGDDYADTCTVIVQDYVRPSRAYNIRVHVEGIDVEFEHYLQTDLTQMPDSIWYTSGNQIALTVPFLTRVGAPQYAPWANKQRCLYNYGSSTPRQIDTYNASILLSPDGSSITTASLRKTSYVKDENWVVLISESRIVLVSNIPLDPAETPSRTGATYTWTGSKDEYEQHFREGIETDINYNYHQRISSAIHSITPQDEVTITVEFSG